MANIKYTLLIISTAAFLTVFISTASAKNTEIRIGSLKVSPWTAIEQSYDDNIFLAAYGAHNNDNITTTTIGANVKLRSSDAEDSKFKFKAAYNADILEYWEHIHQRRVDHTLISSARLDLGHNFFMKAEETFYKTAYPQSTELVGLEKSIYNNVKAYVGYDNKKTGLYGGFEEVRAQYFSTSVPNYNRYIFSVSGYCKPRDKTTLISSYNYAYTLYDKVNFRNSTYYQWIFGVREDITRRLQAEIGAGIRCADFYKNSRAFNTCIASGRLMYRPDRKTYIEFYGLRTLIDSLYAGNNYFSYTTFGGWYKRQLTRKLAIRAGGNYVADVYPEVTTEAWDVGKRIDRIYTADVMLEYKPTAHWILGLEYKYSRRGSRFGKYSYTDNLIMASAKLAL